MSLYRNWRPRTFADLVGQETVVRTLSQALSSGRLVHAYLFSGPRGSGKTSAAKIMARCITCEAGPTATPDNTCRHCLGILDGTALDVIEIDAASNRGIDEIRALRDAVKFAPSTMRKKVYIVDEAHMLTKEGANAFLKTLEEPPPHVVFILATTAPESLPVTILSRCQRFAFRRIATPIMVERMRQIAAAEGIAVNDSALGAIAYRADGGLRDALTMLEQASSFAQGIIDLSTIELAFGSSGRVFAGDILDAFIANDAVGVLRAIESASDAGTEISNLMRSLIAEIRHVVVARIDTGLLSAELVPEDAAKVQTRVERLPQVRALRALRLLSEALMQSRTSGNPRLELESAMLRLTLQGEDPSLEALSSRVRLLEEQLARGEAGFSGSPFPPVQPAAVTLHQDAVALSSAAIDSDAASLSSGNPSHESTTFLSVPTTPPVISGPESTDFAGSHHAESAATNPTGPQVAKTGSTDSAHSPAAGATSILSGPAPSSAAYAPSKSLQTSARASVVKNPAYAANVEAVSSAGQSIVTEPPTLARVKALWPNVVARAEGSLASLRGPLSRSSIVSVDGWSLTLKIADEQNAAIMKARLAPLEAAVSVVLGGECRILITVGSGTQARSAKKRQEESADTTLGLLDYAAKRLGT